MKRPMRLWFMSGRADAFPALSGRRFAIAGSSAATAMTAASVVEPYCSRATPPLGTPGARTAKGNSTPLRAPVAGLGKSEPYGEPRGWK